MRDSFVVKGDGAVPHVAGDQHQPGRAYLVPARGSVALNGVTVGNTVTPVRATAWRGAPAAPDDPIRNATPEGLRAFLNVEDYYAR